MHPEHSVEPAVRPAAMAVAAATPGLAQLNEMAQKVVYYAIVVGGIAVPLSAWAYVSLRGLLS